MTAHKPRRRVCPGQSVRYPVTAHDPFDWLRGGTAEAAAFSVDGFVTTRGGGVSAVFQKYAVPRDGGAVDLTAALQPFGEELAAGVRFAERLQCVHRAFVWPADFPRAGEERAALITSLRPRLVGGLVDLGAGRPVTLQALASGIRKLRGRSFASAKPLLSATSAVECYLASETRDPWPGDIDGVLARRGTGAVEALVEFKTHNRNTPIEREHLGKYGPQDFRRFRVLYQLQDRLAEVQGFAPRLYYVAWGTRDVAHHRHIKIDRVEGERVAETRLLPRPAWGERSGALLAALRL